VTFDKFQFITINGAGHMVRHLLPSPPHLCRSQIIFAFCFLLQVPQFQPGFAQEMFKKFLANEIF
jgi:hypothetical protein